MSWAGRIFFKKNLRSLLPEREQAPSFSVPALTAEEKEKLEGQLELWVQKKGYRQSQRTIQETAESIGTNNSLLYRYFSEKGTDFRTWRTDLRIEDAKQQMNNYPSLPLSAISRLAGFSDRSNFSRLFKERTGLTPLQWRESHQ